MVQIDLTKQIDVSRSVRARQLEGMFDVPPSKTQKQHWRGDVPIDEFDWNVGLIVGPSGSGKSSVARELFGGSLDVPLVWKAKSVIDDFDKGLSIEAITNVCQAVGFNTVPAWLRPFRVLSTGEQFRAGLARRLLELDDPIVIDEFTSVVDRQVAKIGSHAVQKYVRRNDRKFVAVSCHHDIIDWLQPDWTLEPADMTFTRRRLRRRPKIDIRVSPVPHRAWSLFAPFHYLTANLHKGVRCYGLFVGDRIAAFAGVLHRPHPKRRYKGISRVVTLPDWQGLGLAFVLMDTLGAGYKAAGEVLNMYPAHPPFIRSMDRSPNWRLIKKPGVYRPGGPTRTCDINKGGRPCAIFTYCGPALDRDDAERLIGYWHPKAFAA